MFLGFCLFEFFGGRGCLVFLFLFVVVVVFVFVLVYAYNAEKQHNPVSMDKSENQNRRSEIQLCPKLSITRLFCADSSSPTLHWFFLLELFKSSTYFYYYESAQHYWYTLCSTRWPPGSVHLNIRFCRRFFISFHSIQIALKQFTVFCFYKNLFQKRTQTKHSKFESKLYR